MFVLDGKPISPDASFRHPQTGTQYPANWLRHASAEEKAAIGISEEPDPVQPPPTPYVPGPEELLEASDKTVVRVIDDLYKRQEEILALMISKTVIVEAEKPKLPQAALDKMAQREALREEIALKKVEVPG